MEQLLSKGSREGAGVLTLQVHALTIRHLCLPRPSSFPQKDLDDWVKDFVSTSPLVASNQQDLSNRQTRKTVAEQLKRQFE